MSDRSAAVVGIGLATCAGNTVSQLDKSLRDADGTRAEVIAFEESSTRILGCRVRGFDPGRYLEKHELRRLDRSHQLAIVAAEQALEQAGPGPDPSRCALVVGVGFGPAGFLETQYAALTARGPRAVSPLTIPVVMPNSVAAHLSIRFGISGLCNTVALACASGSAAIGEALWMLRNDRADRVLVGGVDALLASGVSAFFARMDAMSSCFDEPSCSSRPFDLGRSGFVMAEGAAFLVLERECVGRPTFGSILGYGANSDSHHLVVPSEGGGGAAACMREAIRDAGMSWEDIGHVNAHGTGTVRNDLAESVAIAATFPGSDIPVTANKGVTGHAIGAAGTIEAIATLSACRDRLVPAIANLDVPDPVCPVALARTTTAVTSSIALSNSFGFGGHNASLVISA